MRKSYQNCAVEEVSKKANRGRQGLFVLRIHKRIRRQNPSSVDKHVLWLALTA